MQCCDGLRILQDNFACSIRQQRQIVKARNAFPEERARLQAAVACAERSIKEMDAARQKLQGHAQSVRHVLRRQNTL